MKWRALALVFILAGCATHNVSSERIWNVKEVIREAGALDGKAILIRGWLPFCTPSACTMFESKEAETSWTPNEKSMLSIAANTSFDRQLGNRTPRNVVLRARVNAACVNYASRNPSSTMIECIRHRPSDLVPIQLLRVSAQPGD